MPFRDDDTRCETCGQRLVPQWDVEKRTVSVGKVRVRLPIQRARCFDIMWKKGREFTETEVFADRVTGSAVNTRVTMWQMCRQIKRLGITIEGLNSFGYRIVRLSEKA